MTKPLAWHVFNSSKWCVSFGHLLLQQLCALLHYIFTVLIVRSWDENWKGLNFKIGFNLTAKLSLIFSLKYTPNSEKNAFHFYIDFSCFHWSICSKWCVLYEKQSWEKLQWKSACSVQKWSSVQMLWFHSCSIT